MFGVYGGLITLMLFLADGGKPADDKLLDANSMVAMGVVTKIEGGVRDEPIRPSYRFRTARGTERTNSAFLDRPGLAVDDSIEIEYSPGQPHINRPVGGRIAMVPRLHLFFVWFFLSGVLSFAIWLCAVWRLRRLMVHGDIAVGTILGSKHLPNVMPTMLRVDYSYRDHNAGEKTASHWVRARSALGERITKNPRQIAVLHDRRGRGVSRLVMADDFVVELDEPDEHGRILDS